MKLIKLSAGVAGWLKKFKDRRDKARSRRDARDRHRRGLGPSLLKVISAKDVISWGLQWSPCPEYSEAKVLELLPEPKTPLEILQMGGVPKIWRAWVVCRREVLSYDALIGLSYDIFGHLLPLWEAWAKENVLAWGEAWTKESRLVWAENAAAYIDFPRMIFDAGPRPKRVPGEFRACAQALDNDITFWWALRSSCQLSVEAKVVLRMASMLAGYTASCGHAFSCLSALDSSKFRGNGYNLDWAFERLTELVEWGYLPDGVNRRERIVERIVCPGIRSKK
jgi:hypothetical protein